jgi:uncharacterized membrane protein YeaQ/YmgE (transglycosylase-associated protein family)
MGILAWILFGLVVGILAKWLMPGDDPGGIIVTALIGIAGGIVGGFVSVALGLGDVEGFDARSIIVAILGSLLLLWGYRRIRHA